MVSLRKFWFYPLIALLAIAVVLTIFGQGHAETTLEDFKAFAREGQVTTVRLSRNDRDFEYRVRFNDETYESSKDPAIPMQELLSGAGLTDAAIGRIDIYYTGASNNPVAIVIRLVINFLPLIAVAALIAFFVRRSVRSRRNRA